MKNFYLPRIATDAPKELNMRAIPLPKPVPPPVINAVFPVKVPGGSIGVFTGLKNFACGFCGFVILDLRSVKLGNQA